MPYSKIISGNPRIQAVLKQKGTVFGSQVSPRVESVYVGDRVQAPYGASFYAQLRGDVRDHAGNAAATIKRTSDGLYRDLLYQWQSAGVDQPRFEFGRLLIEPSATNKCLNWNANPDAALTNVGAGGGLKTRVANVSAIEEANLKSICTEGNVVELENNTGSTIFPVIEGATGNTNVHGASIWMNTFGDDVSFGIGGQRISFNTTRLEQCIYENVTPAGTTSRLQFALSAGERIQFVLNQLEEGTGEMTSPIVTQGASASREVDQLSYASADQFLQNAAGTVLLTWLPAFGQVDTPADSRWELLGLPGRTAARWGFYRHTAGGASEFSFTPETGVDALVAIAGGLQRNVEYKVAYTWGGSNHRVGFSSGTPVWGADAAYTALNPQPSMTVAELTQYRQHFSEIVIFTEEKTQEWINTYYFGAP